MVLSSLIPIVVLILLIVLLRLLLLRLILWRHVVRVLAWIVGFGRRRSHPFYLCIDLVLHCHELLPHVDCQSDAFLSGQHRTGVLLEVLSDVKEHVSFEAFNLESFLET